MSAMGRSRTSAKIGKFDALPRHYGLIMSSDLLQPFKNGVNFLGSLDGVLLGSGSFKVANQELKAVALKDDAGKLPTRQMDDGIVSRLREQLHFAHWAPL